MRYVPAWDAAALRGATLYSFFRTGIAERFGGDDVCERNRERDAGLLPLPALLPLQPDSPGTDRGFREPPHRPQELLMDFMTSQTLFPQSQLRLKNTVTVLQQLSFLFVHFVTFLARCR